ncbi:MAG: alpha/beta hydrolase fold domain-containing protein, partial [Candidatus Latescibacteria bacterium]|nr:alpha/beta hydrolase fold domain-containing protein [Candidatus Latescibacterota bacterium]
MTRWKSLIPILAIFLTPLFAQEQPANRNQTAAENFFARNDKNKDGKLSREEFPERQRRLFNQIDTNKDGLVTLEEDVYYRNNRRRNTVNIPEGVTVHKDLIYGQVGERKLPLDLYLPSDTSSPVPVVIWVHGGGWRGGSKGNGGRALNMTKRGFAVVDVEYRLSGEAIFPAQIEDCKTAIRWVKANAEKYNLDANRIGAWGSSAGGHLVAMMGLTEKAFETEEHSEYSSQIHAVCNWFGPTDFLRMNDFEGRIDHDAAASPESKLIGAAIQENKEKVAAANPITYVSKNDPPM